MMNVLSIPKQVDHELIYSQRVMVRAYERDVPMPKYIPFGAKCIAKRRVVGGFRYKLSYTYNNVEYFMVVSDNQVVINVFPLDSTESISSAIAKLRARMNPCMTI